MLPTYTTFGLYLLFMIAVGAFFYKKETNIKEYLLGGRGVGSWVTAMSAQAINLEKTVARKTPVGDNPAFAFRTFLLRLGLIGPEYKNVRMHLLKRLPGDPAWLRDRNQYESYQRRHTRGGDAR